MQLTFDKVDALPKSRGNQNLLNVANDIYARLTEQHEAGDNGPFRVLVDNGRATPETVAGHIRAKGNVVCVVSVMEKDAEGKPSKVALVCEWKEGYVYTPQKRQSRKAKGEATEGGEATEAPKTGRQGRSEK